MATTKRHWLVYYKQRRPGQAYWLEANAVTDMPPGEYLLMLRTKHQDHESVVMWATEVTEGTAKELRKHL